MADTINEAHEKPAILVFAWLAVGIPLLWGVYETLVKAAQLFQ
jgi:hypothetical protein